jgi:hypothetical protein
MPRKDWPTKVGCGSPRGSLKFEGKKDGGHKIGRHVERRGRKGRKKEKKTSEVVGYSRYKSGEENPCRWFLPGLGSESYASILTRSAEKHSGVEGSEVVVWNAANMPACSSHGSEARIEGKGVRIGTGSGRRGEEG